MPQNSISAQLSNLQQLVADLEAIENGGKKAISNTIKDVKARAPGWIAQEVTAVYNIKKSEITPSGSGKPKKMAGSIQITGETIEELAITYKGRLLTPVHRAARSRSDRTIFSWGQATPRATARAGSHSSE